MYMKFTHWKVAVAMSTGAWSRAAAQMRVESLKTSSWCESELTRYWTSSLTWPGLAELSIEVDGCCPML